jgi:hypothetical protein
MYGNTNAVLTVCTTPTASPRRRAGSVSTRCFSGGCITRPANANAQPRCSRIRPGGLQFRHHPSKHQGPARCSSPARTHAAGTRTGRCILDGPRMSPRTRRRGVCVPRTRPCVPGGTDHAHAPRRGRNTHMHVSVAPPPAPRRPARPCVEPRHKRAGRQGARQPPQKQRTRWQPASMRASRPRRGRARRRRRVADASPLPWSRTSGCLLLASKSHVFSVGRISLCLSVPSER